MICSSENLFRFSGPSPPEGPDSNSLWRKSSVAGHRRSSLECTVRDLPRYGALLAVSSIARIPTEFELRFGGELRPARIVWKGIGKLGIAWA
jgi:hypothetical protein